jgi:uncharacterized phage protein (TIGR02218 family)
MTYQAQESSVESGQPVELYEFTIGGTTYRYTSSEDEVTFNSQTWFPRAIQRSDPAQANEDRKQELTVTLPSDDEVASKYIGIPPGQLMQLVVIRFHRGDTEAYVLWSGRITGAAYKDQGARCLLQGLTTESAFSRAIPRFKYSGLCNHILYDGGCKVSKASFKYTGTVSSEVGNVIVVDGLLSSKGAGWALGGYVTTGDTDYRLVIGQNGDELTLSVNFASSVLSSSVDVYAGCAHTITVCDTKFSNKDNFGGFPQVPTKNPFSVGLD